MARPRTFDEPQVTRRARDAFHDRGYAATSVDHLTAATGLSRSSLYGAFGDKHGLFLRSLSQYCDEHAEAIERELAGDDRGARGRIEQHLRSNAAASAASRRGCLLAKATAELAAGDADVGRTAVDFYAAYERALASCVRGAQAVGDLRPDVDPAAAAALLLSVLRGMQALGAAGQEAAALEGIAETAMATLVSVPPAGSPGP
jgi:AcrR family transcriptional regulator